MIDYVEDVLTDIWEIQIFIAKWLLSCKIGTWNHRIISFLDPSVHKLDWRVSGAQRQRGRHDVASVEVKAAGAGQRFSTLSQRRKCARARVCVCVRARWEYGWWTRCDGSREEKLTGGRCRHRLWRLWYGLWLPTGRRDSLLRSTLPGLGYILLRTAFNNHPIRYLFCVLHSSPNQGINKVLMHPRNNKRGHLRPRRSCSWMRYHNWVTNLGTWT